MRAFLLCVTMGAMACPVAAKAAGEAETASRRIQIIAMGGHALRSTPVVRDEAASATVPPSEAAGAGFRVHDLGRRWIEFEMARDFTATPYAGSASRMAVPLWMRGGTDYAFPAQRYEPQCLFSAYKPSGILRSDAEYRRSRFYGIMSSIACEYGIPVGLFDAMIIRESRYHPGVYSSKNAFGLTQLMPGTAASLGVDRYDVEGNLRGGAKYLRQQLDQFGQYHLALAAYNAGPGRVRNGRVPQITETQAYVQNVLANWSRLSGALGPRSNMPRAVPRPLSGRSAMVSTF